MMSMRPPTAPLSNRQALSKAYAVLAPFSNKQRWEFDNNLAHLDFLTRHLPHDGAVLDLGSYIGILALALRFLGYHVEGADKYLFKTSEANAYSVQHIETLQRIWREHGLAVLDKDVLTDAFDKKYDAVISVAVIEHQAYPRVFVEKMLGIIVPGGLLYVATPNVTNLLNRFRVLLGRAPLANIKEFYMNAEKFNGHWREYTLGELEEMFELSGMHVVQAKNMQSMRPVWRRLSRLPQNILRVVARITPGAGDTNMLLGKKVL